jgi:hypothetical protein
VFDLIEQENVKVTKDQLSNILNLLEKEKLIELDEEKTAEASKTTAAAAAAAAAAKASETTVPKK